MTRKFTFLLMALMALAGFKSWAQNESITVDFESGIPEGWKTIDADGDGFCWFASSDFGANGGSYAAVSESYRDALTPDNYMVSPKLLIGTSASISFYEATCYGWTEPICIMISTTGTNPSDFTQIQRWDVSNQDFAMKSVDLSDYAGQQVYIAFRHYDSTDNYKILIDDITITGATEVQFQKYNITYDNTIQHGTVSGPAEAYEGQTVTLTATPDANYALEHFTVDGEQIVGNTFTMPAHAVNVSATFCVHAELTVNDGTNTNSYVPIYGFYADATCKSQFIIPASALGDMLGGTVSDMTFYLNSSSSISFTGTWDVYVKEVDNTTLSGFVRWSELGSAVYHGKMTITNGQLTVNFTAPITYNGNNLLIGFNETVSGNCPSTYWLGVSQSSNTAWYSTYSNTGNPQQFLPKTTFGYTPNPNLHHITVTQPVEGGTISAPASAISGNIVTLTATPELGYAFGEWITNPAVEIIDNQFVMPSSDITVTATFESVGEMYTITLPELDPEIITGIDALFNSEHVDQAPEGTEITLVYATLNEGYIFNYWTLNGTPLPSNTFTMPAGNVVIDINLTERQRYAVTIDESITNGTVEANPNTDILGGKTVTLTITPATGYGLASLSVTDGSGNPVAMSGYTFNMPESNVTVSATFLPTLTVYESTSTENYTPFYGSYANYGANSQFIIPATALENMYGGTISSLTFYLSSPSNYTYDGTWEVSLKEVEGTTLSALTDWSELEVVYTGNMVVANNKMTVIFDTPFEYNEGNLMIGFHQTAAGTTSYYTFWYGVSQSETTAYYTYQTNYNSYSNTYKYLPKTTFAYTPDLNRHNVTVIQPAEGGTIAATPMVNVAPGTTINLTATPELGYAFEAWIVEDADGNDITVTGDSFEMPASDVTVTATFSTVTMYAITFNLGEYEGLVTVAAKYNGETITEAQEGIEVTLEHTMLSDEYGFKNWIVNGETLTGNTFTMPADAVEIGVSLAELETLTVCDGTSTNRYVPFDSYFCDERYTKSQFIIPATMLEDMAGGVISSMTFFTNFNKVFSSSYGTDTWNVYVKEVENTTLDEYDTEGLTLVYSGTLTAADHELPVAFDNPYTYNGGNLLVYFLETAYYSGTYTSSSSYFYGIIPDVSGYTAIYYGQDSGSVRFIPKTEFTYFPGATRYNITTVSDPVAGGTVTTDPANKATAGTTVALSATPNFGYEFGEWIVTPSSVTITGNTFEMPASDVTVTATFNEVTQYGITFVGIDETLITVAATFGGETITEAPAGTEVTLQYSNLDEGYTFINWTLNGVALAGNTFEMPANDVEIGVVLNERPRYAVIIDGSIAHGTITANPSTNILGNTTVTLTITPAEGYDLGELTVTDGSGDPVTVTNNQFAMPESDVTVTATFIPMLTVYDGTETNMKTAVYAFYGDADNSAAQFVIPASQLEAMAGGTISSLKFYVNPSQNSRLEYLEGPTYAGYIMEIEETTMSNFIDFNAATNMFNGHVSLTNSNSELVINFAEPFTYNGGNLAIAFECTESSSYTNLFYFGTTVTGGGIYRNSATASVTANDFIPKTTFYYTPGEVTYYDINMHVNGNVTVETLRAGRTLQAPTENIPAGLTFCGWTTADIETYTDVAPAYQTKVTEVSDLYAVFSYSEDEPAEGGEIWQKVTDASDLSAGDEIVLVYDNMIMCNREDATYMDYPVANVTISSDVITELPANAAQFTLVANGNYWNLQYEELGETRTLATEESYEELASEDLFESWGLTPLVDFEAITSYNSVLFYNNDIEYYIGYWDYYNQMSMMFFSDACQAYKKGTPMITTTYYMTEALTDGTVAESTSTNNIIITGTHSVNVASGARLEMNEGGLFRNEDAAKFVFEDGAQFYYTGEEIVEATFEKEITGYTGDNDNYYLIANPTDEKEVANLVNEDGYDLYTFKPAQALEWNNEKESNALTSGIGYLYANSETVTLEFAGELTPAGSTDVALVYAGAGDGIDFPGFNLIGNPFACNAYVGKPFYVIQGTELTLSENAYVAPCEGFFVEAAEDDLSVTLSTTVPAPTSLLSLSVSQNRGNVIDRAIVRFDDANDLHKFMMNPDHTNIRLAKHGEEFAAISSEAEGEIPVSFKAEKNGSYTINVDTENVNAHYIHLIDNKTGMDVDLLATPSYTFNASTSDYAYRFKLVFNVEIGDANGNDGDNSSFAYMSNGNLVIEGIEGEATMQIVDVLGRIVSTEIINGSYNKALNLKAGLYILNLNGMTQKIVVE